MLQVTHQEAHACKRVLAVAKHDFDRAKVALDLQPKLAATKQDRAWPGCKAFNLEGESSKRYEEIVGKLRDEQIEFMETTLNHGDRYTIYHKPASLRLLVACRV